MDRLHVTSWYKISVMQRLPSETPTPIRDADAESIKLTRWALIWHRGGRGGHLDFGVTGEEELLSESQLVPQALDLRLEEG